MKIIKIETFDYRKFTFLTYKHEEDIHAWVGEKYPNCSRLTIAAYDPFAHGVQELYKVV